MGIHDRDYYRDGGMFDGWAGQGATIWLIVITCVVFVAQLVTADAGFGGVTAFGVYDPARIAGGEVWRLLTPIFLHLAPISLAFNMYTLYWAGSRLEDRYGGREFLLFYLAAGLVGYSAYFLAQFSGLAPVGREFGGDALGARAAVFAILVLFACHYPRERVLFMFLLPLPVWVMVVGYAVLDVYASIGVQTRIPFSIYLGSASFGLVYYRMGWRITGLMPGVPARSRVVPRLRVATPDPDEADRPEPVPAAVEAPARANDEPLETTVDRILEKVSQHGQESLSAEERDLLFRASELYRKRRK